MIIESLGLFLSRLMCFTAFVNNGTCFAHPLTPADEAKYLTLAHNGDLHAKEMLIRHNLRLVAHVVKKYSGTNEADDLISVGSLGLIKAINTYSTAHNTQFSTYAARCIENEILMLLRVNKKHNATLSTEDLLAADDDGGDLTMLDLVADETQDVENSASSDMLASRLLDCMRAHLSTREYTIMCMRYGFDGHSPLTQREVADKLGISRSYISRLETKSLQILKDVLEK